jgi:hypothetical protein
VTKELSNMATSIPVEIESGTQVPRFHSHNGYWAGKASAPRVSTAIPTVPGNATGRTQQR